MSLFRTASKVAVASSVHGRGQHLAQLGDHSRAGPRGGPGGGPPPPRARGGPPRTGARPRGWRQLVRQPDRTRPAARR